MAYPTAVIFDLWNTLIGDPPGVSDRRDAYRVDGLARALADRGLACDPHDVRAAYESMREEMSRRHARGLDLSLAERVSVFLSEVGTTTEEEPSLAAAVAGVFVNAAREVPPPALPGAVEAVQGLAGAGVRLGLLSNTGVTPGLGLRQVLERYGLAGHFDVLTFSDEVGLCKPAPAVYEHTLAALGTRPRATVFVGDDPELDVAGPVRAGMWTVQVGERESDGTRPHARVAGLPELPEALKSLGLPDGF